MWDIHLKKKPQKDQNIWLLYTLLTINCIIFSQHLDVAWNGFYLDGCKEMAMALSKNSTLQVTKQNRIMSKNLPRYEEIDEKIKRGRDRERDR